MMNRRLVLVSSMVSLAVAGSYWGYGLLRKEILRHVTVTVNNVGHPSDPASVVKTQEVSRQLQSALHTPLAVTRPKEAATSVNPVAPPAEPRAITGREFLAHLKEKTQLTDVERKGLERVLKTAADMQPGIDAEPSPETRAAYQQQLISSIALRMKLILKDDQRVGIAQEGLQDLPRITPDT